MARQDPKDIPVLIVVFTILFLDPDVAVVSTSIIIFASHY